VTISINPEIGRQVFQCTGCTSYTWWDVGLVFNYKAVTLDLRYWDTGRHGVFLARLLTAPRIWAARPS